MFLELFHYLSKYSLVFLKDVSWPLFLNVFIDDLHHASNFSRYLYFADDIKIYHALSVLKIVVYCSLMLILYEVGALLTA
jgi:hypothetical protein